MRSHLWSAIFTGQEKLTGEQPNITPSLVPPLQSYIEINKHRRQNKKLKQVFWWFSSSTYQWNHLTILNYCNNKLQQPSFFCF